MNRALEQVARETTTVIDQASLMPNISSDRRIGLNIQYLAPKVQQTKQAGDSAILVRGEDRFRHFEAEIPADFDLNPQAMNRQAALEQRYKKIASAKVV